MTTNKKQRITVFLNPSLAKQAKAQAIVAGLSMTKITEEALLAYLPKEIVIKKPKL